MENVNQNKQLALAIAIAADAHRKDLDKGGKAYILHPIRIMMRLRTDDPELMQIAILHDVLEDHPDEYSFEALRANDFSDRVLSALLLLTHRDDVSYEQYITTISCNQDCIRVKLEDLRDNSDITRLKGISPKDLKRTEKYHKAFLFLKSKLAD